MLNPFVFHTRYHLVKILGRRAKNPVELLEGIREAPSASIYYHTHRFLQQHHYMSPEPPNDFGYWISNILNLKDLGESMASVDTVSFSDLENLRNAYVEILDKYIKAGNHMVDSRPGEEFQFTSCISFIAPTPYVAHNLREFTQILGHISVHSLYFHFFEARLRLNRDANDFSVWLRDLGEAELAEKISQMDPYTITLEGLRKKIITLVRSKYARN